ncbi:MULTISPECIES: epimerase [unclassified Brenneria]|uniref:epimerase n=1 Tax=unclassified Brenneria TaxID=2634434 RepID=UPI0029C3113E|nr:MULTISPECIES: epimerase [unclassified Brenneria]MDX5629695.1 epimerase [Brenneria sp. L3-3Z]MDX5696841.1 epimerase [Brenneria sp. L4-2C]MEE3663360.1 epimerase [Brenneria sp. g21c3]
MNTRFSSLGRQECLELLRTYPLSVGILAGRWINLSRYLSELEALSLPVLHLDLMDGHFCPQFTVGPWAVEQLPQSFIKDVHLMVSDPWPVAQACVKAGAHIVTLQAEGVTHLHHILTWLGRQQAPVAGGEMPVIRGISLCPSTPIDIILPVLDDVELIQVLAVDPGYGSKLSEHALHARLNQLFTLLGNQRRSKIIAVDGSLSLAELPALKRLGVDRVVSGSALFRNDKLSENASIWLADFSAAH